MGSHRLLFCTWKLKSFLACEFKIAMLISLVGSVLLPSAGEGSADGCFLQLSEDSTLTGFTIYYPKQVPEQVPKPYPWYKGICESCTMQCLCHN